MRYLSLTNFRHSLTQSLRDVEETRTELVVSRAYGDPLVVLRLDDYEALKDVAALLSSEHARSRLQEAIRQRSHVTALPGAQRNGDVIHTG